MSEYQLSVAQCYSDISDSELLRLVRDIQKSIPNCGYRMMDGHLRHRGTRVSQARIHSAMHNVDPEGVALRWRQAINKTSPIQGCRATGVVAHRWQSQID